MRDGGFRFDVLAGPYTASDTHPKQASGFDLTL